jgi:hypothetical protein
MDIAAYFERFDVPYCAVLVIGVAKGVTPPIISPGGVENATVVKSNAVQLSWGRAEKGNIE